MSPPPPIASFATPSPVPKDSLVSFPYPSILLITLNRPRDLNCINSTGHADLDTLFKWYDAEPTLLCAILTGGTSRAFCAGADLKEWNTTNKSTSPCTPARPPLPPSGFGGLSRRTGKKPVICAVNGLCLGGGCEIIINADMVIAEEQAVFALPEVRIGVVAVAGALTR
ncbi:Enoyl-CoA-hydratase, partial [Lachnellula cervina]